MYVWVVSKCEVHEGGQVEAVYTSFYDASTYAEAKGARKPWEEVENGVYEAYVNRVDYYKIEYVEVKGKAS